ncbi:MAG: hypothetical protein LBU39_04865 [Desulfobulbaceae bacterium]|nr:hypothetical protein [Desulfobulbaceae bacterium]
MSQRRGIFIIGDSPIFGRALRLSLEAHGRTPIRDATYETLVLTPAVFAETALFVIELWRKYPTGLRAEGLAVAEELRRCGTAALVVSSLSLGNGIYGAWYWDIASPDSMAERCQSLLRAHWQENMESDFAALKKLLGAYMGKPSGHGEENAPD